MNPNRLHDPYVLVIGSANVDVSVSTDVLPLPGETVIGDASLISVGGKGANQAAAAALCGCATRLVAKVGDDDFGRMVRSELSGRRVDVEHIQTALGARTGLAAIYVARSGQNCIVVVPGANALLTPIDLQALEPLLAAAAILVLQCEIPLPTVYRAIELAARHQVPVILNPAPCRGLDLKPIARHIDYLVPNESEAAQLGGMPVSTITEAETCASRLISQGIECVIITLGAQGCVVADATSSRHRPAHEVKAIDTTGAGDAFVGCIAASLASGNSRDESIRRALIYSALSTTRRGALTSYSTREEFNAASASTSNPRTF